MLERQSAAATGGAAEARQVRVTAFPREQWSAGADVARYVAEHSHAVPLASLGRAAWSLEHAPVEALLTKIRHLGVPLGEFAGTRPLYGVKTGLNEAFLIDTANRDRLVAEDPGCAAIIKPYLRGQDIKRWVPDWQKLWMIFTRRGIDIDRYPSVKRHLLEYRKCLEPCPPGVEMKDWPGRKAGPYQWYEIQDPISYHELFAQPKLLYQEIQFYPTYCMDRSGTLTNNKVFMLVKDDPYLVAVLNSPLMWWHNWRYLPHMKDEALNPAGVLMERLPIAVPTDQILSEVEPAVARVTVLTAAARQSRRDLLYWLAKQFGVVTPGQRLEELGGLTEDDFVAEVRKRLPGKAARLTPATLRALRDGYVETATPLHANTAEAATLERRLSALVNAAYGLTADEEALLWETAPPRMPAVARPGG